MSKVLRAMEEKMASVLVASSTYAHCRWCISKVVRFLVVSKGAPTKAELKNISDTEGVMYTKDSTPLWTQSRIIFRLKELVVLQV